MAEEQRCAQSNAPVLCANNCGFFGNPATLDLCSKCYRDHCRKEQQSQEMQALLSSTADARSTSPLFSFASAPAAASITLPEGASAVPAETSAAAAGPSRCGACRKRVGLIGFKCKCEATFCGAHRYPEQHSCTFDFKAPAKGAIAKANPVIKAAKLDNKI